MRPLRYFPPLAHIALIAGFGLIAAWPQEPPTVLSITGSAADALTAPLLDDRLARVPAPQEYAEQIEQIARRPLFAEGRRAEPAARSATAAQAEPQPTPSEEEEPSRIQMKGSIVDAGSSRALVELPDEGRELWVGQGDSIGDWTVEDIQAGSIRLSRDGQDRMIRMFE